MAISAILLFRYRSACWQRRSSILLVTVGSSLLAALFAEIRDKRKVAEAALHASETQRYLVETERLAALGRLVAGVAHELNSPIGISLTVASTLAQRSTNFVNQIASGSVRRTVLAEFVDGSRDAANQLVSNLQRAGDLIQAFKQVAVDRSQADRRHFDLRVATEQIVASVVPNLPKPRCLLTLDIPSDVILDSYPGAYGQVLTNLIFNAVRHGFADGLGGNILVEASDLGTDQVEITFTDDGRGIPEEVQRHVFDPFFTTQRAKGSTGLGLLHRAFSRDRAARGTNHGNFFAWQRHLHLHDFALGCSKPGRRANERVAAL